MLTAFFVVHEIVRLFPARTVAGEAVRVTEGALALTVTVRDMVAVWFPEPIAVKV